MKIFGICTKSYSEVVTELSKLKLNFVELNKHKKSDTEDYSKYQGILLCRDFFTFKSWYKFLNTNSSVIVFGNVLFLCEIVDIHLLDVVKNSNGFTKTDFDYSILESKGKQVNSKKLKYMNHTARLLNKDIKKDKFMKCFNNLLLFSTIGERRNEVAKLIYDELFNTQNIKRLDKKLREYAMNDRDLLYISSFIKMLKPSLLKIFSQVSDLHKLKSPIHYDKLVDKNITKQGLKFVVKDYTMIKNGKYNITPSDIYNNLVSPK